MSGGARDTSARTGRPVRPPPGKHVMPALEGEPNALEAAFVAGLDPDELNRTASCLFTLNRQRFGPIPGAYVVVCTEPGRRWCVGQLSVDRARPVILFEDLQFKTSGAAKRAAQRLRDTASGS